MNVKNKIKSYCKEFTHNAIVHPLMMFLPKNLGEKLHNWNANWVFSDDN